MHPLKKALPFLSFLQSAMGRNEELDIYDLSVGGSDEPSTRRSADSTAYRSPYDDTKIFLQKVNHSALPGVRISGFITRHC